MRTHEQLAIAIGAARDQIVAALDEHEMQVHGIVAALDEHEMQVHGGRACILERIGMVAFIGHSVGLPITPAVIDLLVRELTRYAAECQGKDCRHPLSTGE